MQTRSMAMVSNASAEDFNLLGAFRALARDDFLRSVEMAKSFTGEAPRATATLAVARSVLEKTPAGCSTTARAVTYPLVNLVSFVLCALYFVLLCALCFVLCSLASESGWTKVPRSKHKLKAKYKVPRPSQLPKSKYSSASSIMRPDPQR